MLASSVCRSPVHAAFQRRAAYGSCGHVEKTNSGGAGWKKTYYSPTTRIARINPSNAREIELDLKNAFAFSR
jgi:hypothetical protein